MQDCQSVTLPVWRNMGLECIEFRKLSWRSLVDWFMAETTQPNPETLSKLSVINKKAGYNERAEGRGSFAALLQTPVCNRLSSCTSSSSDWTTGVFDPSSLEAWLSQVELEEVDNIRVLISQVSEILKDTSLLRNPSSSISVWPRAGKEMDYLFIMEFCFLQDFCQWSCSELSHMALTYNEWLFLMTLPSKLFNNKRGLQFSAMQLKVL